MESLNCNNSCWVYLIEAADEHNIEVAYDLRLSRILDKTDNGLHRLVYLRRFSNPLDAIGHKLLLESVSQQSLKRLIKMNNPDNKNLRSEIFINYEL